MNHVARVAIHIVVNSEKVIPQLGSHFVVKMTLIHIYLLSPMNKVALSRTQVENSSDLVTMR